MPYLGEKGYHLSVKYRLRPQKISPKRRGEARRPGPGLPRRGNFPDPLCKSGKIRYNTPDKFCVCRRVLGMAEPVYKRVLLKISGEALAGDKHTGLDFEMIGQVCDVIKECLDLGVQVGLVVGGGNFWRGAKNSGGKMERTRADHMGMLATVMNCLAVADVCEQKGIPVRVQTAIEMRAIAEPYIRSRAIRHLEKGRVVIFGAGTGNPYFSTDTAAVLRAAEINADVILLAKNVDGVYSADPVKDPTAVKYDTISYDEVLAKHLLVMDTTATSLSMDNHIPVLLFALKEPRNILRALCGEKVGTIVGE